MAGLDQYRNSIDEIDKKITELFEQRMDVVLKVGEYKKKNNLPIFNKNREDDVIKKNLGYLKNQDYIEETEKFFEKLMEISRQLQSRKMKEEDLLKEKNSNSNINVCGYKNIGFYGAQGSFTEEAMIKYFSEDRNSKSYEEFEDVFLAIKNDEISYGILPIENSSTGAISNVYDLLYKYGFFINGEVCIKINQNLIGVEGSNLNEIKEIYSHAQGFEQSSDFLKKYNEWKLIPFHSTASSAKLIKELDDKSKAAIGSKRVANIYNLEIIKENINNQTENFTRFVIISKQLEENKNSNKISVVFSLEDKAGTLYKLLRHFAENNINMIKIESRPMKNGPWKYFLYVDFEGDLSSEKVKKSLYLIEQSSAYFKLLGTYEKNKY
ncbi:prephenate dehydratase [Clostridium botulinum]|uniref:Bifunctional chorismate mutase/prephenate dehydratase n=1 Tax=Clostridium botulinum TaxID=1491 RepID=A0A6B4JI12_CLOBO|nr:prephenate dehydratase [Clostridium botulinum]EES49803.1 chorismate mutase/prephenate dehydratase [Clostridium botulinum E1 str. 'BoNT E Beluga']MBY6759589.1 prephenate dehydratase [Clostridium botulinum]MBY6918497.1 prephenate dehydratase [Clostridium botulinum]MCR1129581.1 prephenate dehydratase [Clostridium botulinum]NFJ56315.1 prephenate dehydratase [Clostridium botulinum]